MEIRNNQNNLGFGYLHIRGYAVPEIARDAINKQRVKRFYEYVLPNAEKTKNKTVIVLNGSDKEEKKLLKALKKLQKTLGISVNRTTKDNTTRNAMIKNDYWFANA